MCFSKLGLMMLYAPIVYGSSLLGFIFHVVGIGAEKKVIWVAAKRRVTFMEHAKARRYLAAVKLPRKSVRVNEPPVLFYLSVFPRVASA